MRGRPSAGTASGTCGRPDSGASATATGSVTPGRSGCSSWLATVPLIIAGAGLSAALGAESFAEVVARTVVALSPGSSDALVADIVEDGSEHGTDQGKLVVVLGLAALVLAVTVLFQHAPWRQQPGLSWLAVGATVTVLIWLGCSGLLGLYVVSAGNFGDTYGPLTAVMALL